MRGGLQSPRCGVDIVRPFAGAPLLLWLVALRCVPGGVPPPSRYGGPSLVVPRVPVRVLGHWAPLLPRRAPPSIEGAASPLWSWLRDSALLEVLRLGGIKDPLYRDAYLG